MTFPSVSPDHLSELQSIIEKHGGNVSAAAKELGIPRSTLRDRVKKIESLQNIEIPERVVEALSDEELINYKIQRFRQKMRAHKAKDMVPIKVKSNEPMGILFFGDPHVDDDGCNWPVLQRHVQLCQETPGLWGANLGDTNNNWVGRLQRLYADQESTETQAWQLVEWFIKSVPWLMLVAGNHDMWSGAGSPLNFITKRSVIDEEWKIRCTLQFPNGEEFKIDARHDHPGHSQWNPLHAQRKAALFNSGCDLYIAGHRHNWALAQFEEQGRIIHLARARGYKHIDHYALVRGFPEQDLGQGLLFVIDPLAPPVRRCHPFVDPEEGADFLTWLRNRH